MYAKCPMYQILQLLPYKCMCVRCINNYVCEPKQSDLGLVVTPQCVPWYLEGQVAGGPQLYNHCVIFGVYTNNRIMAGCGAHLYDRELGVLTSNRCKGWRHLDSPCSCVGVYFIASQCACFSVCVII